MLRYPYFYSLFYKHASFQVLLSQTCRWKKLRAWERKLLRIILNWLVSPCNRSILLWGIGHICYGAKSPCFTKCNFCLVSGFKKHIYILYKVLLFMFTCVYIVYMIMFVVIATLKSLKSVKWHRFPFISFSVVWLSFVLFLVFSFLTRKSSFLELFWEGFPWKCYRIRSE